jgi:molybdate transport repressor ModE-like protein
MKIKPDVRLVVDDVPISLRQTQVLIAISSTKSQNQAARILGISVPVLHRHIKDMEQKLGMDLISTTPRGTILTESGREIIEAHKKFENRVKVRQKPIVACSPVFSHLVLQAVSAVEREGYEIDMLIGDDELNNQYLETGLVNVVVFDDPIYIYREREAYQKPEIVEIVKDTLIHVDRGNTYLRYKYGAQRIGFSNLDLENVNYKIMGETRDYKQLLNSGHSFFINRSLAMRKGLDLESHTPSKMLIHSIFAVRIGEGGELDALMHTLSHIHEK